MKPKSLAQRAQQLATRHRRRADRLCQPFTADDWLRILWRARGRCYLCQQPMPPDDVTVEHLHVMADGGSDAWTNTAPAHKRCAAAKGRKDVYEVLSPAQVRAVHRRLHGPESGDERLLRTMVLAAAEELGLDPFDDRVSTLLLAVLARLGDTQGQGVLSGLTAATAEAAAA